ncbi:MAG: ArnT family glycosyltransferase, partial [Isosphaeraceae bacterium]
MKTDQRADTMGGRGSGAPSGRLWSNAAAACLLSIHALLIGFSLPRNSVTIDEVCHLPAGISYWHYGEFWCYHHNPPLIKLAFALPAVAARVPTDYRRYDSKPDFHPTEMSRDFMLLNKEHYMAIYVMCRRVVLAISVLGGYLVFRWSRELFGDSGGLVSLCLWAFCPELLAHGGLVTMDLGATVVGLAAGYGFWRYLKDPSLEWALVCGGLLGLAEATKFSLALLPPVWIVLAVLAAGTGRLRADGKTVPLRRLLAHAAVVCAVSLYVLNSVYLFEGTGRTLGSFQFKSRLLTGRKPMGPDQYKPPGNRFRGSAVARLPMPFPQDYLLGFDDQMYDIDSGGYYKYLRGEVTQGDGWYYYYLYYLAVKTPVGMIAAMLIAAMLAIRRKAYRADLIDEACLVVPALALFIGVSSQTGINFGRYALPVYPYLFILTGRLGPFLAASRRLWSVAFAGVMIWTAVNVVSVYPYFLTYFNEAVGGPEHGLEHLADSNIDWGQGLVGLKDWLDENAPGRTIQLAYFGSMLPEVLGIKYELPPFGVESYRKAARAELGPVPGLHAVSANYLIRVPFLSPDGNGAWMWVPREAYAYYCRLRPIAVIGHSIYIYDID